jgi:hypothetical protein
MHKSFGSDCRNGHSERGKEPQGPLTDGTMGHGRDSSVLTGFVCAESMLGPVVCWSRRRRTAQTALIAPFAAEILK